jgi:hypothetical protein
MPYTIELDKITDAYITSLRTKWKAAKTKHDAVLKTKKIAFAKDLGPMLEKRLNLYKTVKAYKTGDSVLILKANLNSIKTNGKDIKAAAESYQKKIVGLGDPAEKELHGVLGTIIKDAGDFDINYVNAKLKK